MYYLQLLGLVKVTTGTYINVNTPELISGKIQVQPAQYPYNWYLMK